MKALIYKQLITENKGIQLSAYVDRYTKINFTCELGHYNSLTPRSFDNGSWCAECDKLAELDIYRQIIKKNGGDLKSTSYKNNREKLLFDCGKGHMVEMRGFAIKEGHWCITCGYESMVRTNRAKKFDEYQKIIVDILKGSCVSTKEEYVNGNKIIHYLCIEKHDCYMRGRALKRGSTCTKCSGNEKLTIEEINAIAILKGGKCLSSEYKDAHSKLDFECINLHTWSATPDSIKNKHSWCPICKVHVREEICRKIFEIMFQMPFPKTKPKWLISDKDRILELDGFNGNNIAFEHDGEYHYFDVHSTGEDLERRKFLDNLKDKLCYENDVMLIRIPYNVDKYDIQNHIISKCNELNIIIPVPDIIDIDKLSIGYDSKLEPFRAYAKLKFGELLSTTYINCKTKLRWRCKNDHVFDDIPYNVMNRKGYCKICKE